MFAVNLISHFCLFSIWSCHRRRTMCDAIRIWNVVFSVMPATPYQNRYHNFFGAYCKLLRDTAIDRERKEKKQKNNTRLRFRLEEKKRWGLIAYRERAKSPRALTSFSHRFEISISHLHELPHSFVCVCPAREMRRRKKIKMASTPVRVSAFDQINGWLIVFFFRHLLSSGGEQCATDYLVTFPP